MASSGGDGNDGQLARYARHIQLITIDINPTFSAARALPVDRAQPGPEQQLEGDARQHAEERVCKRCHAYGNARYDGISPAPVPAKAAAALLALVTTAPG